MEPVSSWQRIKNIADSNKRRKVEDVLSPFVFGDHLIKRMMDTFEGQIKLANSTDENLRKQTDLFWENTFVRRLLDGSEKGTYLGMDLGGTNFRIVHVELNGNEAKTETKYYELPKPLLSGPCIGIFDYIATCLKAYLQGKTLDTTKAIPLGFTFSFPSVQTSLKHSTLSTWTKSITCPDGPGLDAAVLLEQAIQRQENFPVDIDVVARISDTTGTLLAGNLLDKNCRIALILGTGSNAAFVEYTKNIERWETCCKDDDSSEIVVINSEFGALGDNGCLDFMRTDCDKEVDKYSNHKGSYTFEKSFSGLYLGELVRLVLLKLTKAGVLFDGQNTEALEQRWAMKTSHVTNIERDTDENVSNTLSFLKEFGIASPSEEDIALVKEVCEKLSMRGSYIVAAAMVVMLNHISLPEVTIAIDGSLYEHHPNYHRHIQDLISKWRPDTKTTLKLVKDGSGQGGALAAAISEKNAHIQNGGI